MKDILLLKVKKHLQSNILPFENVKGVKECHHQEGFQQKDFFQCSCQETQQLNNNI